jgi:hypothetical protein
MEGRMILLAALPYWNHSRMIGVAILAIGAYVALAGAIAWWNAR